MISDAHCVYSIKRRPLNIGARHHAGKIELMIAFLLLYGWRSANLCRTLAASCSAQENSTGMGTAIDRLVGQERGLDKAYLPPWLATHRNDKYGVRKKTHSNGVLIAQWACASEEWTPISNLQLHYNHTKIGRFTPILSIRIVLSSFYLLIPHFENFSLQLELHVCRKRDA